MTKKRSRKRVRRKRKTHNEFRGGCINCNEYETMIWRTCGTMSPSKYRKLMQSCPGMTKQKLNLLLQDYELQCKLLSMECKSMFRKIGNKPPMIALLGGADQEDNFRNARDTYIRRPETKQEKPSKKQKKKSTLDWKKECPNNYSKKKKCVIDPVTKDCIKENEIAGDKTGSMFSDGNCYSTYNLQSHARFQYNKNPKRTSLSLPSGKEYSKNDLIKLTKTRLESYAHETLLYTINAAVTQKINSTADENAKSFEQFIEQLKKSKDEPQKKSMLWGAFKRAVSTVSVLALKSLYKLGSWLADKGVSIGKFIASNPRMARFFLSMIKSMINTFCQKLAISFGMAKYKYKGVGSRIKDGFLNSDVLLMAGEGMIANVFSGDALSGMLGAVAKSIPGVAQVAAAAESLAGPAKEAAKFAAEAALYQQDINKSFGSVLEILGMVVNPQKCMSLNSEVVYTFGDTKDGSTVENGGLFGGGEPDKLQQMNQNTKEVQLILDEIITDKKKMYYRKKSRKQSRKQSKRKQSRRQSRRQSRSRSQKSRQPTRSRRRKQSRRRRSRSHSRNKYQNNSQIYTY